MAQDRIGVGPPNVENLRINRMPMFQVCVFALFIFLIPRLVVAQDEIPPQSAAVGYKTNTFSSEFTKSTVDVGNTRRSGFKWYLWQFFGNRPTNVRTLRFNGDGSITLLGDNNSKGGNLATVAPAKNASKFIGVAFGGGAYFEAVFKFDPDTVVLSKSWPAFWSAALEHLVSLDSVQWRGQAQGYEHFIEPDFFEYDIPGGGNYYGGAIHDWYGIWNKTCKGYCGALAPNYKRQVPSSTDFMRYHRYGLLWVPATDTTAGYAEYYFDNQRVGQRTSWSKFRDQAPPTALRSLQPWSFGVMDRQHLVVILGTGVDEPMTVQSVNVWQASAARNLTVR